ncbi:MAG TPA: ABC transporter permease [Phycisphaerales bacterium]|nr:ABC transporter permease [Phycisphaerales bacterium]HMP36206.1 ABC transporter permease [Phycisphaerales bacterium]
MDAERRSGAALALRGAGVLARREFLRFLRTPVRLVAAVGTGLLLWLVVGGGLAGSVVSPGTGSEEERFGYAAYLVPGAMTLVAMFAAIFSSIAVIEDRREGFLQAVLVSPTPRWAIAAGIVTGGAAVAWLQAALLLPLAWIAGIPVGAGAAIAALIVLWLPAVAIQSLGTAFAWRCRDAASFHAVMNLLLMPLWLLSDAFFPVDGAAAWLRWVIQLNPLSWCAEAVRSALRDGAPAPWPLLGAAGFALLAFAAAVVAARRAGR